MDRIALICLLPIHEPAEKRDEAIGGPELVPFPEPLDPLIPGRLIFLEAGDHGGIHAQQGCAEGGAQLSIVRGVRYGLEPEVELVELGGMEDVAAPADDAWNVDVPQRLLYITRLRTRPDQHGDVGGTHLSSIQEGVFLEQRGDAAAKLPGDSVVRVRYRDLRLSRPGLLFTGEPDNVDSRGAVGVNGQLVFPLVGSGDLLVGDRLEPERVLPRSEESVDGADQLRVGAPVGLHRVDVVAGVLDGIQVGEDVGSPEAVDGLFRIPDKEHRQLAGGLDLLEDPVLHRVSVLEFVDQRCMVMAADRLGQARPAIALQGLVEIPENIVKPHQAPLPHPPRQLSTNCIGKFLFQFEDTGIQRFAESPGFFIEAFTGFKEWVGGRLGARLFRLGLQALVKSGGGEFIEIAGQLKSGTGIGFEETI